MGITRKQFHYISGSVSSTKGTFAHNLGKTPTAILFSIIGGTGTAAVILYDRANSDGQNVVVVGNDANYDVFVGLLVTET